MLEYADSFKSEKCVLIWIGSSAKILLLNIQYITVSCCSIVQTNSKNKTLRMHRNI